MKLLNLLRLAKAKLEALVEAHLSLPLDDGEATAKVGTEEHGSGFFEGRG